MLLIYIIFVQLICYPNKRKPSIIIIMKNVNLLDTNSRFFHRSPLRMHNQMVAYKNWSNPKLIDKVTSRSTEQNKGSRKIT